MAKHRNGFLLVGVGLSIMLHVVVVPLVRLQHPSDAAQEDVPRLRVDRALPTPPPTPRPTPAPTPVPRATPPPVRHPLVAPPRLRIRAPHTTARGAHGPRESPNRYDTGRPDGVLQTSPQPSSPPVTGGTVPASAMPSAVPVPTATLLTCARPNVPAATTRAAQPDMPALAQQQGISGEVAVVVSLDAASRIVGARIQSSPSVLLNAAALAAARGSSFRTEVRDCKPVGADYLFTVEFASD